MKTQSSKKKGQNYKIGGYVIEKLPGNNGNAYSSSKRIYQMISVNENNVMIRSDDHSSTDIASETNSDKKGGIIVFPSDADVIGSIAKTVNEKSRKNNKVSWIAGRFFNGRYTAKSGKLFEKNSIAAEIVGVGSDELIEFAARFCNDLATETVLVKDYTTQNIIFLNRDKI